jgi:hypothetical protein
MQAAYVVVVINHWVAVRGQWFCDSWSRGVPIKDAPHRRKRVRFVYVVTIASGATDA